MTVHIYDWRVVRADHHAAHVLTGRVLGHPKLPDGATVYTSPIAHFEQRGLLLIVRTNNREYKMGRMHPSLASVYDDAYTALLTNLGESK